MRRHLTAIPEWQAALMSDDGVRLITAADRPRASAALASGFAEDPVFCWLAGRPDSEQRLAGYWRAVINVLTTEKASVTPYVAGDGDSVALWRPVDKWKVETGEVLRALPAYIAAVRHRMLGGLALLSAMEKQHPEEPHHYLEFVATHRDRQGKGLGAAVLQPVLDQADDEGLGCYLESSNPKNMSFYFRLGFEERGEIQGKRGGPPVFPMWRNPR